MRWLTAVVVAFALLLVGWTVGQKSQDDQQAKLDALERRLAETERKVSELEKKVAELTKQVRQLSAPRGIIIFPRPFEWRIPEEWQIFEWHLPEKRQGFGLPMPAPRPFVQPYYYPLEKQP